MGSGSRPVAIDLFCGAGGLSLGLRRAGFDTRVGVDFDKNALATYQTNHPEAKTVLRDIALVTGAELLKLAATHEIDLIAGGPSCQGFSTHGKRIQDDPRNFLFEHFVRLVNEIKPTMFLMENVKGMLTYSKGAFRQQIEEAFKEIGYKTDFTMVCAADYGVPQMRHRVFFTGTRVKNLPLSFPEPTHGAAGSGLRPYVTLKQAISDLPLMKGDYTRAARPYARPPRGDYQTYLRAGADSKVLLHTSHALSEQATRLARHILPGQGLRAVPVSELPERFKKMRTIGNGQLRRDCTTLYHRLDPERPSYTITCNYRNVASGPFLHPYEDRPLSDREAARLMSFPDSYRFVGSGIAFQIGNAVPPVLGEAVGQHLVKLIDSVKRVRYSRVA